MQVAAIILAFGTTLVAVPLTVIAVRKMLAVIKTGGPAINRTNDPVARSVNMLKETFLHTRMLQWTWIGALHWFAYAAFLLLSTAVLQSYFQLFKADFVWPIIGKFFLYEWASEALGLIGALAIVPLIIYRQVIHPRRVGRKSRFFGSTMWQAYFVELMVLLESIAILFIRGAEYNLAKAHGGEDAEKATAFHFPISQYVAKLFPTGPESIGSLENAIYLIAALKIASAMVWLAVISANLTMGVAWHRFLAWPNIWFKRNADGSTALGGLQPIYLGGKPLDMEAMEDLEEEDFEKLGVGKVEDFSWKGILDFTTCTECGRCQSQCPAWNTEKPLSPKLLMMGLRDHAYAKAPLLAKDSDTLTEAEQKEVERPLIGDEDMYGVIDPDVLWSCTNCGACVQQCPVDIEHVDHIDDMRRFQVLVESNFPAELNNIFKGLERKGNPWGMNPKDRMDWAKGLDFEVKQVGVDIESLEEVEWLFWVGCAGAYEDRAKKTTQAVAELLNTAGVDFAVLGDGETCTGDSARRAGNEIVFMQLAMENAEVLKETKAKKVVSTCAHCFNTLKNEYAEFGVELEVVHHTQLLNRLVREGKLKPVAPSAEADTKTITYHDPCFLGRHNQVYEPPRELLQVIPGAKFTEMPRNSEKSFCCGAGGARMWMEETLGSRININRTEEAVATGADQIAVGCPFCRVMLSDGLTAKQSAGEAREEVEVLDVAQMLLASVKRAPSEPVASNESASESDPVPDAVEQGASKEDIEAAAASGTAVAAGEINEPTTTVSDEEAAAASDIEVDSDGVGHGEATESDRRGDQSQDRESASGSDESSSGERASSDQTGSEESTAVESHAEDSGTDKSEGTASQEVAETEGHEPESENDDRDAPQKEDPEKEDAAWANVGSVNTDLLPGSADSSASTEAETAPPVDTDHDADQSGTDQDTDQSETDHDADNETDDREPASVETEPVESEPVEPSADDTVTPEGIIAVDAVEAPEPNEDIAELSDANPSGADLSKAATDGVPGTVEDVPEHADESSDKVRDDGDTPGN